MNCWMSTLIQRKTLRKQRTRKKGDSALIFDGRKNIASRKLFKQVPGLQDIKNGSKLAKSFGIKSNIGSFRFTVPYFSNGSVATGRWAPLIAPRMLQSPEAAGRLLQNCSSLLQDCNTQQICSLMVFWEKPLDSDMCPMN